MLTHYRARRRLQYVAGPGLQAKLFSSERARERLRVAGRLVHERTWLLIVSDFLPGGRTAAMFAAGALGLPAPRFYAFIVPGALLWAVLYTVLGIAGGSLFEEGWGAFAVLGQRERLPDPQPGPPQHDDHRAQPEPVAVLAGVAHHGDDLIDRRWVGGVANALVARRAPGVVAGHGRR
jgi:SNARE associated Golgi protein